MANLDSIKRRKCPHGYSRKGMVSRVYRAWQSMKKRCFDTSRPEYPRYGGRGITVCDRWLKFENFIADMGDCPYGMSLDRINNDGNYEPLNCRWATVDEQLKNRRNTIFLTLNGVTKSALEWSRELKISRKLICRRLQRGLPVDECLHTGHLASVKYWSRKKPK